MKARLGDCLETMRAMEDNSVDSVVTDPPYGLSFMGKKWDYDVPKVEVWKEAMRVLKAGGHILVACGTRTQHRMAVNIEDAGFEIRDIVAWVYGSGFPKSLNIGKAVDKLQGNERDVLPPKQFADGTYQRKTSTAGKYSKHRGQAKNTKGNSKYEGWGTALKPAMELWTLARKPLSEKTIVKNVLKHGTGGINIDESRVEYESKNDSDATLRANTKGSGRYNKTDNINIDLPPANQDYNPNKGRFPANLIHDGSDEVVGLFPNTKSGWRNSDKSIDTNGASFKTSPTPRTGEHYTDSGNASRFFYCAKASKSERNAGLEGFEEKKQDLSRKEGNVGGDNPRNRGVNKRANHHPTVKPIKLMQYLTRLITPKGGTVLDPYMGSGTTGIACKKEGFEFIGIELDEDYYKIAKARIEKLEHQHELF